LSPFVFCHIISMPSKKKNINRDQINCTGARFGKLKNDLSMGFVGLPNVGKSTLTNLLSGANHAEAANYPFCTIDPNVTRCVVPDLKLSYLNDIYKPTSFIPAVMKVVDIAGLIKGASEGAGLGNAFLSHISCVDGLYHLVRAFEDDKVIHVEDSINPIRDLETIERELCLKDLERLEGKIRDEYEVVRKEKGLSRATSENDVPVKECILIAYEKCKKNLEKTVPIHSKAVEFTLAEVEVIKHWDLLTTKPQVYVINMSMKDFIRKGNKWLSKIKEWVDNHGGGSIIPMSCEFEKEIADIKCTREREAFLNDCTNKAKSQGLEGSQFIVKSVIPRLIRSGRQSLCLQSFYTAGPKEVRAWTIRKGTLAPQAAGVIHTDFERGFIKAEVCSFDDFKDLHQGLASMSKVKEAGKYKQEGKTYEMQDGDIVVFMHNINKKNRV